MSVVTDHLQARAVKFEAIPHEQTYTSIDEARALGIAADEVIKTLVLNTSFGHALALIPGSRRLDMRRVKEATGDAGARLATEDELQRDFKGFELGAIPPLASLLGVPAYVDSEVVQHETIVFAAGTQTESVRARTEDLLRGESVTVAPLTRHAEEED